MEKRSETKSSVAGHPEETEVLPHLSYSAHSDIHRWGILWPLVAGVWGGDPSLACFPACGHTVRAL